jgi:hybrid cluster-associated redox disulfide protein
MSEEAKPKITKDMSIMSIIEMNPNAVAVFQKHGLGCIGCMAAHYETVEEGANAHGLNIDELMKDLNA